jgi:hypothetical protein
MFRKQLNSHSIRTCIIYSWKAVTLNLLHRTIVVAHMFHRIPSACIYYEYCSSSYSSFVFLFPFFFLILQAYSSLDLGCDIQGAAIK